MSIDRERLVALLDALDASPRCLDCMLNRVAVYHQL